jgi:hypothetical protein
LQVQHYHYNSTEQIARCCKRLIKPKPVKTIEEFNMTNFDINLPDVVTVSDLTDFYVAAKAVGVELSGKGRLPKGKVARAILDSGRTIESTDFFSADYADSGSVTGTGGEYNRQKRALIAQREAAIEKAHADYKAALAQLRADEGRPDVPVERPKGNAVRVSAKVVRVDTTDAENPVLKRNKADKVMFGPVRSVTLTAAEVRTLADGVGKRGKPSDAHTLYAAVVKGGWLPTSLLSTPDWETVLLSDVDFESVTIPVEN